MNEVAERMFAELADRRIDAETNLARVRRGDDVGMFDISDAIDGFRYGQDRLKSLEGNFLGQLEEIERDTVEFERVSGFKRPE